MLRVTLEAHETLTLKLEGKISGPWVEVLESCWARTRQASASRLVRVNLNEVTFVDDAGKALLARMANAGTEFVAAGPLISLLVSMNG
jgi:ABC-type transporter Mla MlaB component